MSESDSSDAEYTVNFFYKVPVGGPESREWTEGPFLSLKKARRRIRVYAREHFKDGAPGLLTVAILNSRGVAVRAQTFDAAVAALKINETIA